MRVSSLAPMLAVCLSAPLPAATLPGDLALEVVIDNNGGIARPMVVTHAGDGSGRLFIAGRAGQIWIKPAASQTVLPTPFLDISALISDIDENGLLGLAFDPDYQTNRRFYVSYTDNDSDSVIARYTASQANPDLADPASAAILIRVDQGSTKHKGGDIHFGLDGYLYIAFGDGAEGFGLDDCNRAQSLTPQDVIDNDSDSDCTGDAGFAGNPASRALMGKLLRIDVAGTTPAGSETCGANADGSADYATPPANPFAGSNGGSGRCDEIFAYGLRNPYRFGIDRQTGDIFIGDVGESTMEEIDFIAADSPGALDFGWQRCEGTLGDCSDSVAPILTDDRGEGSCAITGGKRYRGAIVALQGLYVFSDYCTGTIRFATEVAGQWTAVPWLSGGFGQHVCFGEDEAGELYVCEINADRVKRFASNEKPVAVFGDGFEGSN